MAAWARLILWLAGQRGVCRLPGLTFRLPVTNFIQLVWCYKHCAPCQHQQQMNSCWDASTSRSNIITCVSVVPFSFTVHSISASEGFTHPSLGCCIVIAPSRNWRWQSAYNNLAICRFFHLLGQSLANCGSLTVLELQVTAGPDTTETVEGRTAHWLHYLLRWSRGWAIPTRNLRYSPPRKSNSVFSLQGKKNN